jgi:3-deoxy-manno-octulosonate cytidylyltransferase (CMP-KDO synthetase)
MADVVAIIPARYGSTRFPAKMIKDLCGKPLVLHTYERCCEAETIGRAIIAVDDPRVEEALKPYGVPVMMTRPDHASGTDRIAEVAERLETELIVNVQGDEVMISPRVIDQVAGALMDKPEAVMATARHRLPDPAKYNNPNNVKVVCDQEGMALYFSRSPIPHVRDEADRAAGHLEHWLHIGIYGFRRDFLLTYAGLPQTTLEKLEKLEQLRVIENGYKIAVVDTEYESIGVDTPEDFEAVRAMLEGRQG